MNNFLKISALLLGLIICNQIHSAKEWVKVRNQICQYYEPYYEEGFEATWEGNVVDGMADGYGKLEKYTGGRLYGVYEGHIKKGHLEGMATYTCYYENGDKRVFVAPFEDGEIIGEGTQKDFPANGQNGTYQGNLVNYYIHGYGSVNNVNGFSFEGLFNMGNCFTGKAKNGKGKSYYLYQGQEVDKLPSDYNEKYNPKIGEQVIEYFDKNWVRCGQKNAAFYRVITYKAPNRPQGIIKDYYMSGKLQSEFSCVYIDYRDDHLNFNTGETKWYYENGQLSRQCNYVNNTIIGDDVTFYENGNKQSITKYDKKGIIQSHEVWYLSGKQYLTAKYKDGRLVNDCYTEYDENGVASKVRMEDFILNMQVWESDDDVSKSEVKSPHSLGFIGTGKNWIRRTNYIDVDQDKDFSVEVTAGLSEDRKNNRGYGMLLGYKDWSNYLLFVVSGNGYYKIQNVFEGMNIDIKDWTLSSAINKEIAQNYLKVMKIADKMVFSINGTIVENVDAVRFRGSQYGVIIGGKGNYSFDNFTYKEYGSSQRNIATSAVPSSDSNEVSLDGSGTGFFIDKRGFLATNYHVTKDTKGIYVCIQKDGVWHSYHAVVVRNDPTNDLSIIRIDDPEFEQFPSLPYNFVTDVEEIAADIFTLGYPQVHVMGSDVKYTSGTINSKTGYQGDPTHYQISAHIDHGNSGGPMFNSKGAIVGITDGGLDKAKFGDVNYAIKSSYLKSLVDALPMKLNLPNDKSIERLSRVEQIKVLSKYTALILIDLP